MRLFVCLIDSDGRGIPDAVRREHERVPRARGLAFEWRSTTGLSVLLATNDLPADSLLAGHGGWLAVGTARLDNRAELEQWAGCRGQHLSELEVVLRLVARNGAGSVLRILGDFAFLVWNGGERTGVAACDAFAVRKLHYAARTGFLAFASRAEALAIDDQYDVQFLAEWAAGAALSPGLTVYDGVRALPAGHFASVEGGRLKVQEYWSPRNIEPAPPSSIPEHEAAAMLRELITDAVRLRLGNEGNTWAQLSGGLDSSSVVSVAQWLTERRAVAHGLAGTVTYVDRQGTGADEREYSDAVVSRWGVRNETIVDPPIWCDDRDPPPLIDQPRPDFMFYPRERRLCAIVKAGGGHVLLTGQGSDELLRGNMFFFADWVAQGRIRDAVREMARRAAIGHVSFWELAYRNAVVPLLPRIMRLKLGPDVTQLPPWIDRAIARRYRLRERTFETVLYAGRRGRKYHDGVAACVEVVGRIIGHLILEDGLDVRHPFLHRPLVEFGLRLPPDLCVRPHARKWLLREAMRGILPDAIRTRVGKGTPSERHAWSLVSQRGLLEPLVRNPLLADLGVIDPSQLGAAFDAVPHHSASATDLHGTLQGVLAIEAWLQMRAGRWPRRGPPGSAGCASRSHASSTGGLSGGNI